MDISKAEEKGLYLLESPQIILSFVYCTNGGGDSTGCHVFEETACVHKIIF